MIWLPAPQISEALEPRDGSFCLGIILRKKKKQTYFLQFMCPYPHKTSYKLKDLVLTLEERKLEIIIVSVIAI